MPEKKRRGPKPRPRSLLKSDSLHAAVSPIDKRRVSAAAIALRVSESDFIRDSVMAKVLEVEGKQEAKNEQ